jgi:hypothetical protein
MAAPRARSRWRSGRCDIWRGVRLSHGDGQISARYACQECGASIRNGPAAASVRRVEQPRRGILARRPAEEPGLAAAQGRQERTLDFVGLSPARAAAPPRHLTGIAELDRVCGGGLVPGSAMLVGGDPGIGKSTCCCRRRGRWRGAAAAAAYISGEEAIDQVRLRAGGSASPTRRCARRRDQRARHRRLARHRPIGAAARGHRFDPDHVSRHARQRARHGEPGARRGAGADPPRQAARLCAGAGRPRHQGRA